MLRIGILKVRRGEKMNSNGKGLLTRVLMLALGVFLALPAVALAGQGRGKPTDIFVNGHDARAGRVDWNDNQRRRERDERRRDREERRREREERQDERRDDRRGRDWDRYDNYGGSYQLRQTGLNAGYNEGIEEGRNDRKRGDRFDYRDESDYRNATKDYSSRLGDRELYRRYFREGFANGYEDGYRGY